MFEKAKWIWRRETAQNDEYVDFTAVLPVKAGEKYTLKVASDSNYALYIGGRLCEFGQYADYPDYKVADVIDITKHLTVGENKLCFVVWYYGKNSMTYTHGEAGLIFEVLEGEQAVLWSGAETLSRLSRGYISYEQKNISGQLGFTYHFDAKDYDGFYESGEGEGFGCSREVEGISYDICERPVKKLVLQERVNGKLCLEGLFRYDSPAARVADDMQNAALSYRNFGSFDTYLSAWKDGVVLGQPGEAVENQGVFFIVDLLAETAGFLDFDLELPCDCRIDIGYGEHLLDGRCRTAIRNFSAVYEGKRGRNRFLNEFRRFGCRYIQFFVHAPEVKIYYAGLRPTVYPVVKKAYKSGNLLRDTIYEVCENTLLQSMHEHYEDCPWREQALYCMDSRNQMLCGYYAFGEYAFPRASLKLIGYGMTDRGLLSICYPSGNALKIPSFSTVYFIQMYEYIKYSGDTSLAAEKYELLVKLLGTFLEKMDGKCGVIESFNEPNCWNFYEWSEGLAGDLSQAAKDGRESKHEAALNGFLSLALQSMAKIAEALGKGEDAAEYRAKAENLNRAIAAVFFDGKVGLFKNTLEQEAEAYNVLTNALCLLCGAAEGLDKTKILAALETNGEAELGVRLVPDTISMNTFRFDALLKEDRAKYGKVILDEIDRTYLYMLRNGATSFWETINGAADFDHAGSLCHGWSAMPVYYYEILK